MRPVFRCVSDAAPFPVSHGTSIIYFGRTHFHLRFYRGCQIGIFESALDPLGPKNSQKGPIGATHRKNRIDDLKATEISFVLPFGFSGFINGPATEFHPVAFGRFQPFSRTHFGSGTPKTGPNRLFVLQTQPSYGKRVTLEFSRLMHKHIKQPGYGPFLPKISFLIHWAGGAKLPFRCNSLRRSTPTGKYKNLFYLSLLAPQGALGGLAF